MTTPQVVAVALYHRDHLSRGSARQSLGFEAFHWSIIMTPPVSQGKECLVYDATDACYIDPETFRMINPTMDWWFRDKPVDPELSSKLLGRLVIGRIPDGAHVSSVELTAFFREIPLPIKNTHPQQSCVTWATDAIRKMQRQGWVPEFEVDQFKHSALSYADDRMKGLGSVEPKVKHYEI